MAKAATIGVRVDEELKDEAQRVFDGMGIPMSLAIEMFLKQVVEKRRLPFEIGLNDTLAPECEEHERQFWQSFMIWHFNVWPRFDSVEITKKAINELDYAEVWPGQIAEDYIRGGLRDISKMDTMQREAYFEISTLRSLLSDAKELIYWALGTEKLFVPSLSAKYAGEVDKWRYQRLWAQKAQSMWGTDLAKTGMLTADFIGDVDASDVSDSPDKGAALPDEKLMGLCREWLADYLGGGDEFDMLEKLVWETDDPDDMWEALENAGLLEDFECYVMETSGEA